MSTERRPTLCIVAGPNGSGKTTTLLKTNFLN
ncbi:MAG: GspE family protein [Bacteroidaceae bacterium]|nr:GspE family protein [Bacteroidaceae bacterium]